MLYKTVLFLQPCLQMLHTNFSGVAGERRGGVSCRQGQELPHRLLWRHRHDGLHQHPHARHPRLRPRHRTERHQPPHQRSQLACEVNETATSLWTRKDSSL